MHDVYDQNHFQPQNWASTFMLTGAIISERCNSDRSLKSFLFFTGNQLESMPVNVPSSLHRIDLQGNKISTLVDPTFARKYLPQLKELNLRDNNIK